MDVEYTVRFSHEDKEWVATCSTEPFMSFLDPSPLKALAGLIILMEGE